MLSVRRRDFVALLGGAAAAWPLAAEAQQARKLPTIGFLGAASESAWGPWLAAFLQRLHELGWIEGRTIAVNVQWADGRDKRYAEIATEFVHLKVDVIVTAGGAVSAAMKATSVIPIVFAIANSPVESGLVASLALPGGNVTGLSGQHADTVGKRLELLREVSGGRAVAVWPMWDIPQRSWSWVMLWTQPGHSALTWSNSKFGERKRSPLHLMPLTAGLMLCTFVPIHSWSPSRPGSSPLCRARGCPRFLVLADTLRREV